MGGFDPEAKMSLQNPMKILVTGGTGYIGSHMVLVLLESGHDVVVLDNLSNSQQVSLERIADLAKRSPQFIQGDIRDSDLLKSLFAGHTFEAVIHFAGLKAVGESVARPLDYYDNNVAGSLRLFQAMAEAGVKKLVFSSSATVYGDPASVPISEDFPLSTTNPYGTTKLHIENMLRDLQAADPAWHIAILRYFNPVGAHPSGQIGEDPNGIPGNLLPFIAQVAVGKREYLNVFGADYPTADGTGVRDYIHVLDLVEGHLKALDALQQHPLLICNLGTGKGYSVLEMVAAFARAAGRPIPYRIAPRRAGDIAECYAAPARARQLLGWRASRDLAQMCNDHWAWQSSNPNGYS